jgi:hypothetical protein
MNQNETSPLLSGISRQADPKKTINFFQSFVKAFSDDSQGFRIKKERYMLEALKLQLRQKNLSQAVWAHFLTKSLQIKSCHEVLVFL